MDLTTLIVGSSAAKHWFTDWREPKDLDAFSDKPWGDTLPSRVYGQKDLGDFFWDDRLRELIGATNWMGYRYANPDEMYTIKHSHAYWELKNNSWGKHMADLLDLKRRGAKLVPEWHDVLYKVWEDLHGKKQVDLTQESGEFFTDAVKRIYDHDSIHHSVAYTPGKPIYDECLKDDKSVQMDMAKVWAMPHERIVQMFREEIYVTALERLVIPNDYKYSPGAAYQWALRRTITSLTKGRSAQFIVSHFDEFRAPDLNYVQWHKNNSHFLTRLETA
ncbi:Uncharacterised protein [Mycobacteroides abscessus subsp. massiliense]|nr:Uncharacterised protein [Mycobacteroides abscessus subsp. massiliense]SKM35067.1 Uncharacterised protein [Mycobacteroides abscessus subsp. massiliense]SKP08935.1 Uncharacterised protein [Mycobacteroides abscessus subsp. massiliense]SKP94613.1 Uncharacterised protein [Mycobacteroides abscessus subsp. massiliense]SLK59612.1 Uncharacterised protein [Mycobacteroides abscessus subsp. massiliense]